MAKSVDKLTKEDLQTQPVWKMLPSDQKGEFMASPINRLPVSSLDGKIIGCNVRFANGDAHFAMIGNVDVENPKMTEHFLTLSIWVKGRWFHLARYFDPDIKKKGPASLGKLLHLKEKDIFPIAYNLRPFVKDAPECLSGHVLRAPKKRLSRSERIDLILE